MATDLRFNPCFLVNPAKRAASLYRWRHNIYAHKLLQSLSVKHGNKDPLHNCSIDGYLSGAAIFVFAMRLVTQNFSEKADYP